MRRAAILAVVACLIGCGAPTTVAVDAATPDAPSVDAFPRPPRVPIDAGGIATRTCASVRDCLDGEICDRDFPRGRCAPTCTTDADCPTATLCDYGRCLARCDLGSNQCPADAMCLAISSGPQMARAVCSASCSPRADATDQRCQVSECRANYCTNATFGSGAVGDACASNADCVTGQCLRTLPGGMCARYMRMVSSAELLAPGPMPHGGCDDTEAIRGTLEGDLAYCVPRCRVDTDCRDGYRCDLVGLDPSAPTHDDGACTAWRCDDTSPCPAGRTCAGYGITSLRACFVTPP